jgi:hypothetical protein
MDKNPSERKSSDTTKKSILSRRLSAQPNLSALKQQYAGKAEYNFSTLRFSQYPQISAYSSPNFLRFTSF